MNKVQIGMILFLLINVGCNSHEEKKVFQELGNMTGKQIQLLDSLEIYSASGVNNLEIDHRGFKLVTYIDGTCSNCVLQLRAWEDYISKNATNNVEYIFYIYTIDSYYIKETLKTLEFSQSVFLDSTDAFFKTNNISEEKIYQTFLLDQNNEVVLLGNPLYNKKLEELYDRVVYSNN